MRHLIASSLIVLAIAHAASSEEVLREITWETMRQKAQLLAGQIEPGPSSGGPGCLKLASSDGRPQTVQVLRIEKPGVSSSRFAICGKVRYEGVQDESHLEMRTHFADGSQFFTKTLAPGGLLGKLQGSSGWRSFALPFDCLRTTARPTVLTVDVVFAGGGAVWIGPLKLVQYAPNEDALAVPGQWWTERTAGWIGGIGGSVLGCLGGLIGILAGTGRARKIVLGLSKTLVCIGLAALLAGAVAFVLSQPYAVWYPLLLLGGITAGVLGPLHAKMRRHYEQRELRWMAALDAATGRASRSPI